MSEVPLHRITWISAKDVLHLADLGFKQISVEPVVAPPEADYAIREEDLPKICEEYDSLARK